MKAGEVLLLETLGHEQCHREGVPKRERCDCASCRYKIKRTGFIRDTILNHHIRVLRQSGVAVARNRNEVHTEAFNSRNEVYHLSLAAMRNREHDVVALNDAEVAVHRLSWVKKECRRTGA